LVNRWMEVHQFNHHLRTKRQSHFQNLALRRAGKT